MVALASALLVGSASRAGDEAKPLRADSRAPFHHLVTLYDETNKAIRPGDPNPPPYSPAATCGKCHAVGQVAHGWHFNAAEAGPKSGRPGEPWILTDATTRTQISLTYRAWPGAVRPSDLGITEWRFTGLFGRVLPASPTPAPPVAGSPPDMTARWEQSGQLQVDCMLCHAGDNSYDMSERARQIEQENYRWAPTAAMGLAIIRGSAKDMPDVIDPMAPPDPDNPGKSGPKVVYNKTRFDGNDNVFFNVTRRPAAQRCYSCHSSQPASAEDRPRWHSDRDVHLSRGLSCIDCHRNGMDHMIARGYEGESALRGDKALATLSCRGCHLGSEQPGATGVALGGRHGAPRPLHRGLPPLHLEKLSCTACHSGSWPSDTAGMVQTSLAHGLGLVHDQYRHRDWHTPPHIVEGLFIRGSDGKIAPHRALYPSYWGKQQGGKITPVPPDSVKKLAATTLPAAKAGEAQPLADLSWEQMAAALTLLNADKTVPGHAVYVNHGYVYKLDAKGRIDNPYAREEVPPYTWPIAHDVRPAAQSLGARGCTDCHAEGAPLFFGRVPAPGAALDPSAAARVMYQLRGENGDMWLMWARSFKTRTLFLVTCAVGGAMLGCVLTLYFFRGLGALTSYRRPRGPAVD